MRNGTRIASVICVALLACFATGAAWASPDAALTGGLKELVASWERGDPRLASHLAMHVTDSKGSPLVMLRLAPGTRLEHVLPQLNAQGFRLTTHSTINPSLVEGYLPLSAARSVAAISGIQAVRATQLPIKHAGAVQSQAVALQKADIAQANGFDGSGIRVGALSDSYDGCGAKCSTSAADDVASGDLPAGGVTVLQDLLDGTGTDEGRAMLQLVHDIAPGAQLGFATAYGGMLGFAENILALRSQFHADVIVDDVYYSDEPMYSDGIIAQAVDLVSHAGTAYYSSAGNNGLEAWEGVYSPLSFARAQDLVADGRANVHLEQIPAAIRPRSVHNFRNPDGSPSITQRFTSDGPGANIVSFQWDEPFFLGLVKTDYNMYVFDAAGNWMDPNSASFPGFYTTDNNIVSDEAAELLFLPPFPGEIHGGANQSDYQFVIGKVNDGPARHIKYITLNGLGVSQRQAAPSVFGHAAASGGQAVAATYYAIPNFPEDFSAGGPVTIYLDTDGKRLRHPEVRRVPQVTAADGVDTTFFGFDSDGNGFPNFFGTSAAAPNAAATAALALQAAGGPRSLTPRKLYRRLQETADPIPMPDDRSFAAAFAGPVLVMLTGDWTRQGRYFNVSVHRSESTRIRSISLDVTAANLLFSGNPNRFWIGESNGVALADITRTRSADGRTLTLKFAPGKLPGGSRFSFGMSVFNPIEGTTQEDPDRFRDAIVTVTTEDGGSYTGTIYAGEPEEENRFTGHGLVNAAAATAVDD